MHSSLNDANFEVRADPSFFIRFLTSKNGEVWVTLVPSRSFSFFPRTVDSQGLLRGARSDRLVRVEVAACAREPTDRMPDSSRPNRTQLRPL